MDTANTAQALCASHASTVATFTCVRCGTFACEACRGTTAEGLCRACGTAEAPRLAVGDTVAQALRVLGQHPLPVGLFVAGQVGFGFVAQLPIQRAILRASAEAAGLAAPRGEVAVRLSQLGAALPFNAALILLALAFFAVANAVFLRHMGDVLEGREQPLAQTLREGLSRALPTFVCNLLVAVGSGMATLLCVVPGLYLFLSWAFAPVVVVLEGAGPLSALSRSWKRTEGHRWGVLGLMAVFFMPRLVVGILVGRAAWDAGPALEANVLTTVLTRGVIGVTTAFGLLMLLVAWLRLSGRPLRG